MTTTTGTGSEIFPNAVYIIQSLFENQEQNANFAPGRRYVPHNGILLLFSGYYVLASIICKLQIAAGNLENTQRLHPSR